MNQIYLKDYIHKDTHELKGVKMGNKVKEDSRILDLEKEFQEIYIYIPSQVGYILKSFWVGLFEDLISGIGDEDLFWGRVRFYSEAGELYRYLPDIRATVREVLGLES